MWPVWTRQQSHVYFSEIKACWNKYPSCLSWRVFVLESIASNPIVCLKLKASHLLWRRSSFKVIQAGHHHDVVWCWILKFCCAFSFSLLGSLPVLLHGVGACSSITGRTESPVHSHHCVSQPFDLKWKRSLPQSGFLPIGWTEAPSSPAMGDSRSCSHVYLNGNVLAKAALSFISLFNGPLFLSQFTPAPRNSRICFLQY